MPAIFRKNEKKVYKISRALVLILVLALFAACSPSLESRIEKFEAAINSGNVSDVMLFYSDVVTVEVGGVSTPMDDVELRQLAEWDSIVHTHVHFTIKGVSRDTVTCIKTESNDWYRAFGIDTVYFDPWVFIFEDDLIRGMKSTLTQESTQRMAGAFREFYTWAYENRPRKLKELMPEGKPIYGPGSAKKWMELLKEWHEDNTGS